MTIPKQEYIHHKNKGIKGHKRKNGIKNLRVRVRHFPEMPPIPNHKRTSQKE